MPQTDILSAIRQIAAERKIDAEDIIEAIKEGIKISYKEEAGMAEDDDSLDVQIDPEKGQIQVFMTKTIVDDEAMDETEILLADAKKIDPKAKVDGEVVVDITADGDFGRIAAQSARQVILQKLRESEKEAVLRQFTDKVGTIISVVVQRILPDGNVLCEVNKARAVMPKNDRIPSEFYKLGSSIKVLLKGIEEDTRGKYMNVSRADNNFLKELFRLEVPEIESGSVEIMSIAREPGSRSKVAVRSNAAGVDPIGSCVGQKGVRINAVSNELRSGDHEEKIDIILWDEDIERFLMNSIRPAESIRIILDDKDEQVATIVVPDEQYSLAIGKEGQNARLANKLTGWRIDINSESGKENLGQELNSSEEESEPTEANLEEGLTSDLNEENVSDAADTEVDAVESEEDSEE